MKSEAMSITHYRNTIPVLFTLSGKYTENINKGAKTLQP